MSVKDEKIEAMIRPSVEALGYVFWGMEYIPQGKHSVLRVYIDSEEGINVDDCAKASHQISGILDVEDPITSEYNLEVSSPGVDRLLFTIEQYEKYAGHVVKVKLKYAFDNKRVFKGVLVGLEDQDVVLRVGAEELMLPIDSIEKAQIVPTFA